ncbi:MAG: hypothetical protein WDW38_010787 [Sanguina aurantia]
MTAAAEVQAAAAVAAAAGESNAAAIEIDCGEASSVPESLLVQGRQDVAEAAVRSGAQLLDQSAHLVRESAGKGGAAKVASEPIPVGCQSREDGRALKLLNMVQCLNALMERAVCREMPLFGWIEGTLFTGIADELRLLRCSLCKLKFLRVLEFKTRQGGLQGRGSASVRDRPTSPARDASRGKRRWTVAPTHQPTAAAAAAVVDATAAVAVNAAWPLQHALLVSDPAAASTVPKPTAATAASATTAATAAAATTAAAAAVVEAAAAGARVQGSGHSTAACSTSRHQLSSATLLRCGQDSAPHPLSCNAAGLALMQRPTGCALRQTPAEAPPGGAVGASPARAATAATAATAAAVAVDAAKDESTPRPVPPGQGASPSAAAHEPLTNPPIDRTHAQPGSTPLHTPDRKRERPMPAPPSLKPSPKPVFGPPGLTGRAALWPEAMQSAALQAMMYHSMVGSLVAAAACPRDAHTQGRRLLRVLQLSDVRVLSCDVQQHAVKVCGSKLSTLREVLERLYSTAAKLPAMSCMVQVNVEVLSHRWAQQTAASAIQVAAAASCNGPRRSGVQWMQGLVGAQLDMWHGRVAPSGVGRASAWKCDRCSHQAACLVRPVTAAPRSEPASLE